MVAYSVGVIISFTGLNSLFPQAVRPKMRSKIRSEMIDLFLIILFFIGTFSKMKDISSDECNCYISRLSALSRKSYALMTKMPFSVYHGAGVSLMMIFLKVSLIWSRELDSCCILTSSGIAKADWM